MSSFTNAVKLLRNGTLTKESGTNIFEVAKSFLWLIDYENKKWKIKVKKWFKTDFWSIPKFLRWYFNPTKYLAYILHDNLYSRLYEIYIVDKNDYNIQRKFADGIMREALKVEGMNRSDRYIVWKWCRIFGGIYQQYLWYKEWKITEQNIPKYIIIIVWVINYLCKIPKKLEQRFTNFFW